MFVQQLIIKLFSIPDFIGYSISDEGIVPSRVGIAFVLALDRTGVLGKLIDANKAMDDIIQNFRDQMTTVDNVNTARTAAEGEIMKNYRGVFDLLIEKQEAFQNEFHEWCVFHSISLYIHSYEILIGFFWFFITLIIVWSSTAIRLVFTHLLVLHSRDLAIRLIES